MSTLLYFALAVIVGLQARLLLPHGPLVRDHRGPACRTTRCIRRIVERPRRLEWALAGRPAPGRCGLGLSLYALAKWNDAGFGPLELPRHAADRDPGRDAHRLRDADCASRRSSSASWGCGAGRRRSVRHGDEASNSARQSRPRLLTPGVSATASRFGPARRSSHPFALALRGLPAVFLVMRPPTRPATSRITCSLPRASPSTGTSIWERLREPRADARVVNVFPLDGSHAADYDGVRAAAAVARRRPVCVARPGCRARRADRRQLAMVLIAALLADQLFRLLRDLGFRGATEFRPGLRSSSARRYSSSPARSTRRFPARCSSSSRCESWSGARRRPQRSRLVGAPPPPSSGSTCATSRCRWAYSPGSSSPRADRATCAAGSRRLRRVIRGAACVCAAGPS